MAFRGLQTSPFLLGRDPLALHSKSAGEVGMLGEIISRTSGKTQVNRHSLHERTVDTTIVTGSSPRLVDLRLAGFLLLLLELINGLAKYLAKQIFCLRRG